MKVIFTKGIQASGKSTWAKQFCETNQNWIRVSRDALRHMRGKYWIPKQEKLISKWEQYLILGALEDGKSVVIDATNLNPKYYNNLKTIILTEFPDTKIESKVFDVTLEEAIKRDLKREDSVGAEIITKFYNTYIKKEEPEKVREPMKQDENLPHAIICDLDGTIALMNGRNPHDEGNVDKDLPNKEIIKLVETYLSYSGDVIFLSGRGNECREKTIQWIKDHIQIMDKEYILYMRKEKDNRKDCIVKQELFDAHIKGKYYIDFVLDDRLQVCRLWYSMGLTLLRVGDPDANF